MTSVAWAADNQHVLYTTARNPAKRSDRLWCHKVGRAGADRLIKDETDEHFELEVERSKVRLAVGRGQVPAMRRRQLGAASPGPVRGIPCRALEDFYDDAGVALCRSSDCGRGRGARRAS